MPTSNHQPSLLHATIVLTLLASILALLAALECHTWVIRTQPTAPFFPSLLYGCILWLWWVPLALALWQTGTNHPWLLRLSPRAATTQLFLSLAISAIHLQILQTTIHLLARHWPALWLAGYNTLHYFTPQRASIELLTCTILWATAITIATQLSAQRQSLHTLALREQLAAAQLQALQMQLQPHFLFNALNSVAALVDLNRNHEASTMLAHLDTLLRNSLTRPRPEKISLTEELTFIESYLAIQQVRFHDRLEIKIDTTPEALQGLVPCFLLQPIVENAIQHGVTALRQGGRITATARRLGNTLHMQVSDNGPANAPIHNQGHGIGLRNTQDRLNFFYPATHHFTASPLPSGGFQVTIQIPFEPALA